MRYTLKLVYAIICILVSFPILSTYSDHSNFLCQAQVRDTTGFTFVLSWSDRVADLDLYLIIPDSINGNDTVYWGNRSGNHGGKLDVDDTKGYGPEKISQQVINIAAGNLAELGANYYGPQNGKQTKTWIDIYRGEKEIWALGPCTLKPGRWWSAGKVNLFSGIVSDTSCTTKSMNKLSKRPK